MSPAPAAPTSPPGGEALDADVLAELRVVGGEPLIRELMSIFAERTPRRLRSAESALAAADLEATASALHSLRSAAGTVGARHLAWLAGRLEAAARGGDDDLSAGLVRLRREVERALHAARRLFREAE